MPSVRFQRRSLADGFFDGVNRLGAVSVPDRRKCQPCASRVQLRCPVYAPRRRPTSRVHLDAVGCAGSDIEGFQRLPARVRVLVEGHQCPRRRPDRVGQPSPPAASWVRWGRTDSSGGSAGLLRTRKALVSDGVRRQELWQDRIRERKEAIRGQDTWKYRPSLLRTPARRGAGVVFAHVFL